MPTSVQNNNRNTQLLGQKVAIVTGASERTASGVAHALAAAGAAVLVTDVEHGPAEELAAAIRASGGQAQAGLLNVLVESDWISAIAQALEQFGGVDILVNRTGHCCVKRFADCSLDDFQSMQNHSVAAVFLGIKHGMRAMRPDGSVGRGGSIINFTPTVNLNGMTGMGGFFSCKGAVRMLSKAAALECASLGYDIRVNSIHPVLGHAGGNWSLVRSLADVDDSLGGVLVESGFSAPGDDVDALSRLVLALVADSGRGVNGKGFVVGEHAESAMHQASAGMH